MFLKNTLLFRGGVKYTNTVSEIKESICNQSITKYPRSLNIEDLSGSIYDNFYCNDTWLSKNIPLYRVFISYFFKNRIGMLLGMQCWIRKSSGRNKGYINTLRNIFSKDCFPLGGNLDNRKEDIVLFADYRPLCDTSRLFDFIRLKESYKKEFEEFAIKYGLKHSIGVHVRATDKMPKRHIKKLFKMIDNLLNKEQNLSIFLSTDNIEIQKMFNGRYNGRIITYPKYLPENNSDVGLHKWAEANMESVQKDMMFKESLADMWLLSMCKYLYWQGNSSFSYISKILKNEKYRTFNWMGVLR